uniref:phosphoribosylformylglycinamidine synthase n=1 Tax=Nothobranchius korthausae TaxID=1143690 RepID=A0A1A8FCB2_9TELE
MAVLRFYSSEALNGRALQRAAKLCPHLSVTTELCYNVELTGSESLSAEQKEVLLWLFRPLLQVEPLSEEPNLIEGSGERLVEIGPRLNFSTAWSTNAVSICQSAGLANVTRVELSRRFLIKPKNGQSVSELSADIKKLIECLHDSMTECVYQHPIMSFTVETKPQAVFEVAIEASDGASDYGNKFGEPVLAGFARSFGMRLANGERREWIKPIMFSGGLGSIEDAHVKKEEAEPGMEVVKIGGPVYRIGVGGGAASSVHVQGDNCSNRDLGAVQRGDAEMEQKMNRALRACLERSDGNPICSIHDQGAGGNGNVLKELSEPAGAVIYCNRFKKGDPTLSVLELWGAEYQESNALLLRPSDRSFLERVCQREKCPADFVGYITGDGKIVLVDDEAGEQPDRVRHPVDLQLEWVLGKMPQKEFKMETLAVTHPPLKLPAELTVRDALQRVLRLPAVASKRYLTNKVDRSVTGLVAQQQCVGPLHTPLADVAVVALSPFGLEGAATAVGEQPIKGLLCPAAGARMAVGEALTNLVFARVTALKDVKCSGNWMWAAKLPGEGACLWEACRAMCEVMGQLGVAIDGGKDSLSMAARVGKETVKAPGALVISAYAVCPDITATVTPDLDDPDGKGVLLWVPVSPGHQRLGGSALAQCYSQLGDRSPDLDQPGVLSACFNTTQRLIQDRLLSAGHDISDGGLISCLLEMAFAGNRGVDVELSSAGFGVMELLFSEELGLVLEVSQSDLETVQRRYSEAGVECRRIGRTCGFGPEALVRVQVDGQEVLNESLAGLRAVWEDTSFQLERHQANELCVKQEEEGLLKRTQPFFKLTFNPLETPDVHQFTAGPPRVAVVREEGSNGDREMSVSLFMAGFQVWDVTMQDLCSGSLSLEPFKAVVFVGGFSYADVLGSAKGWAATVAYNPKAKTAFDHFQQREDTLSLGVCNGCQLLALLGWVGQSEDGANPEVALTHNKSGRFESRFVSVGIQKSPSIWLRGMEGSALGVWVAHGEGLMQFRNSQVQNRIISSSLAPIRYLDDQGHPTEEYPLNPNGSPQGWETPSHDAPPRTLHPGLAVALGPEGPEAFTHPITLAEHVQERCCLVQQHRLTTVLKYLSNTFALAVTLMHHYCEWFVFEPAKE